jgi:hypothetical protein
VHSVSVWVAILLLLGKLRSRMFAVSLTVEYVAADSRHLLVSSIEEMWNGEGGAKKDRIVPIDHLCALMYSHIRKVTRTSCWLDPRPIATQSVGSYMFEFESGFRVQQTVGKSLVVCSLSTLILCLPRQLPKWRARRYALLDETYLWWLLARRRAEQHRRGDTHATQHMLVRRNSRSTENCTQQGYYAAA